MDTKQISFRDKFPGKLKRYQRHPNISIHIHTYPYISKISVWPKFPDGDGNGSGGSGARGGAADGAQVHMPCGDCVFDNRRRVGVSGLKEREERAKRIGWVVTRR